MKTFIFVFVLLLLASLNLSKNLKINPSKIMLSLSSFEKISDKKDEDKINLNLPQDYIYNSFSEKLVGKNKEKNDEENFDLNLPDGYVIGGFSQKFAKSNYNLNK